MSRKLSFDREEDFLAALKELVKSGVQSNDISAYTPYHVGEAEKILEPGPGWIKIFALTGAAAGGLTGFAFTIYTVLSWPLITGGKPLISIPAFIIIAFALTILFGSLASFGGFILLSRLPNFRAFTPKEEFGNKFVIIYNDKGQK